MQECDDCRGSGQYVGLQAVEACRGCGGSGKTPSDAAAADYCQPSDPSHYDECDAVPLIGSGSGYTRRVTFSGATGYTAVQWECAKTNVRYTRFYSCNEKFYASSFSHMTIEGADGPVLMTVIDANGRVRHAWVLQIRS